MSARPSEDTSPRLVYLYGFVGAEDRTASDALAGEDGVSPGAPVRLVESGSLAGVVSDVPASDFSPEVLMRRLNEPAALEAVARGHEAVLDRLVAAGTVLPARLATLYGSDAELRRLMAERDSELQAALRRLHGVREWGLKVFVDRARLLTWLGTHAEPVSPPPPEASGGAAYLAARQQERALEQRFRDTVLAATQDLHETLRAAAADARVVGAPSDKGERELALNAAYLVPLQREGELRSAVAAHGARLEERGFAVALTGPWPPYNFLSDAP